MANQPTKIILKEPLAIVKLKLVKLDDRQYSTPMRH